MRQWSKKSQPEKNQFLLDKMKSTYSSYLRIARDAYGKISGDYYGSDEGVWEAPPAECHIDEDHA